MGCAEHVILTSSKSFICAVSSEEDRKRVRLPCATELFVLCENSNEKCHQNISSKFLISWRTPKFLCFSAEIRKFGPQRVCTCLGCTAFFGLALGSTCQGSAQAWNWTLFPDFRQERNNFLNSKFKLIDWIVSEQQFARTCKCYSFCRAVFTLWWRQETIILLHYIDNWPVAQSKAITTPSVNFHFGRRECAPPND